jgi:hypothetical protein
MLKFQIDLDFTVFLLILSRNDFDGDFLARISILDEQKRYSFQFWETLDKNTIREPGLYAGMRRLYRLTACAFIQTKSPSCSC